VLWGIRQLATDEDYFMALKHWLLVIVALILVIGYLAFFGPDALVWRAEINKGNGLVVRIDTFREQRGHLPQSLSEIGLDSKDLDKYFYQECSDSRYLLSFGTELGESMTYDSSSRSWKGINMTCR
jgi:hypothetical protein